MASTPQDFFANSPSGLELYSSVAEAVTGIGPVDIRVTKSQIAFRHRKGFAWVWRPDQYVRSDVPAVLSFALPRPLESSRLKEVAHPAPSVWMHHLELREVDDLDAEVIRWLGAAYEAAA